MTDQQIDFNPPVEKKYNNDPGLIAFALFLVVFLGISVFMLKHPDKDINALNQSYNLGYQEGFNNGTAVGENTTINTLRTICDYKDLNYSVSVVSENQQAICSFKPQGWRAR